MPFHKVVTGLFTKRTDEEFIDEFCDVLEEIVDGDYDLICWSRSGGTRILMYSPLLGRNVVYEEGLATNVLPHTQIIADMSKSENEFQIPVTTKRRNAHDIAVGTLDDWMSDMLTGTGTPLRVEEVEGRPVEAKSPPKGNVKTSPKVKSSAEPTKKTKTAKPVKSKAKSDSADETMMRIFGSSVVKAADDYGIPMADWSN